jgi:hypothetical protein
MKRTVFTALGLVALTFIGCNLSTKEATVVTEKEAPVAMITVATPTQTTSEFEAQALEECIAIAQMMDEVKLVEAAAEQKLNDSLVKAEEALKIALEKSIAAQKRRMETPEALAKRAQEAELWFETNYATAMEQYKANYEGLRINLTTDGVIYDVQMFVNGEWKKDQELMKHLAKVKVTKDLAPGKAVAITVKNV